jgi:Major Facilitator Superfamily.
MTARQRSVEAVALTRNVVALTSGGLLWTAGHFGVLAVLPLFLTIRASTPAASASSWGRPGWPKLVARPFAGWIADAFGRRVPLGLALLLLSVASALLLVPAGWVVLANRMLTGAAFSIGTTAFYTLVVEVAPSNAAARCRATWR